MDCESIWKLLSVYADGETTPDETAMVETHIAVCSVCARDLAFMQQTSGLLNRVVEVEPPARLREAIFAATIYRPTFAERIVSALRRALAPAGVRYGVVAVAGAAAAITFVVLRQGADVLPGLVEYHSTPRAVIAEAPPREGTLEPRSPGAPESRLTITLPPATKRSAPERTRLAYAVQQRLARPTSGVKHAVVVRRTPRVRQPVAVARNDRKTVDLKAKVPVTVVNPNVTMPDPAPEAMTPVVESAMETSVTPMAGSEMNLAAAAPAVPVAPAITRIQLAASSRTLNAGQIASLADLKRSLRQQNGAWNLPEMRQDGGRKAIRIDVFKGRF